MRYQTPSLITVGDASEMIQGFIHPLHPMDNVPNRQIWTGALSTTLEQE